jgi:hypothetical protein
MAKVPGNSFRERRLLPPVPYRQGEGLNGVNPGMQLDAPERPLMVL